MYYLDSDILVDILRGHPPAVEWLASLEDEEILISAFVVMELMEGCRDQSELRRLTRFLEPFAVDWPREEVFRRAVDTFGRAHLSHGIGVIDTLIAHMAMARGLPLCTFNVGHYTGIPDLETIQPYSR